MSLQLTLRALTCRWGRLRSAPSVVLRLADSTVSSLRWQTCGRSSRRCKGPKNKEDLKQLKKDLGILKNPVIGLAAAVTQSVSQLSRARKAKEAAPKEKSKGGTGKSSQPDPKRAKMEGAELMEHAPTFARQFQNVPSKHALDKLLADANNIDQPILISKVAIAEQLDNILKPGSGAKTELDGAANTLALTV